MTIVRDIHLHRRREGIVRCTDLANLMGIDQRVLDGDLGS